MLRHLLSSIESKIRKNRGQARTSEDTPMVPANAKGESHTHEVAIESSTVRAARSIKEPLSWSGVPQESSLSGYSSPIFSLSVGPERQPFSVHEAVLAQSPVLKRCCQSGFQESLVKHINLPEDDVQVFGRVLEYLYKGDFDTSYASIFDLANGLAEVYLMADKYQIDQLKVLTVTKLTENFRGVARDPQVFFTMSQRIYANTPESDLPFKQYFRAEAPHYLQAMQEPVADQIDEFLSAGGSFATELFKVQDQVWQTKYEVMSQALRDAQARQARAMRGWRTEQELRDRFKEIFAEDHRAFHPRCRRCYADVCLFI